MAVNTRATTGLILALDARFAIAATGHRCPLYPPKADKDQTCRHVRFVPHADSYTAEKSSLDHLSARRTQSRKPESDTGSCGC
jgi:predicted small lipoprotein YifL